MSFFFPPDCLFAQCSGNKVESHNEKLCFHEQEEESTISVMTTAAAVKRVLACYRKSALSVLFIVASKAVFFFLCVCVLVFDMLTSLMLFFSRFHISLILPHPLFLSFFFLFSQFS